MLENHNNFIMYSRSSIDILQKDSDANAIFFGVGESKRSNNNFSFIAKPYICTIAHVK